MEQIKYFNDFLSKTRKFYLNNSTISKKFVDRKYPVITKSSKGSAKDGSKNGCPKCCTCKCCAITSGVIFGVIGM